MYSHCNKFVFSLFSRINVRNNVFPIGLHSRLHFSHTMSTNTFQQWPTNKINNLMNSVKSNKIFGILTETISWKILVILVHSSKTINQRICETALCQHSTVPNTIHLLSLSPFIASFLQVKPLTPPQLPKFLHSPLYLFG